MVAQAIPSLEGRSPAAGKTDIDALPSEQSRVD
jgi:hypothetical protein